MDDWITIMHFKNSHEAGIVMSKLESESILCHLNNARFGYQTEVHLQVSESDYPDAEKILIQMGYLSGKVNKPFLYDFIMNIPMLFRFGYTLKVLIILGTILSLLALLIVAAFL